MGSLGVRHNWATSLSLSTFMHWRRKWQPTPVFLPGESHGEAWWAAVHGVAQSRTWLKWLSSSSSSSHWVFPGGSARKESACNEGDLGSIPGSERSPGEGNGYPLPVFMPKEFHGQRSLVGYSPWGHKQTQWVTNTFTFSSQELAVVSCKTQIPTCF